MTFSLLEKEIPNARDFLIKKKKAFGRKRRQRHRGRRLRKPLFSDICAEEREEKKVGRRF